MSFTAKILDKYQQTAIARLFSSAVVKELAQKGYSPLLGRLISETLEVKESALSLTLFDLYQNAFLLLRQRDNRHEYAYKAAITKGIMLGRHSLNTAAMVNEFRVGQCKADVAIFNGTSTAYEIKSERDSLNRLENQLTTYRDFFAKVYVVTGEPHLSAIEKSAPEDVGILCLNKRHAISVIREAIEDPTRPKPRIILDAIQTKEAILILESLGIEPPRLTNTQMRAGLAEIFSSLAPETIHKHVVKVLRESRSAKNLGTILPLVPSSLQAALFSTPLKKKEQETLAVSIQQTIREALNWAR